MARWIEASVQADGEAAEALLGVLRPLCPDGVVATQALEASDADTGWDGAAPTGPVTLRGYFLSDTEAPGRQRQVEEAVWHLSTIAPGTISLPTFREIGEEDWANAWKRYYHPQRIGRRLLLTPTWESVTNEPDDVVVRLDPGAAFGTGLHPTTRLALQLLEATPLQGARLLDVGTGSGILAIAGVLLGAADAVAVDTSPVAVEVARENAAVNGLERRVAVQEGSVAEAPGAYEVVVANIVAKVLIALAPALTSAVAPGGELLLSGVIETAEVEVLVTFAVLGFMPVEHLAEGDWRAIRFRRED